MKNQVVVAAQQALKDKGQDPGMIDGKMGRRTRTALADYQNTEGLTVTGWVDDATRAKLGMEPHTKKVEHAAAVEASRCPCWYAVAGFAMRVIVDRLSKTYQDRSGPELVALENIALRVEPEEFVAVLGPSGCGKSTLLGIMAGLLPATAGEVFFEGERRVGQPLTATVFQEFALFPWRTVRGNVEFGLEELGAAPAERKERVARFIAMTGLEGFEDKFPHQLSGGMRQRVGIARALAVDPAVLLMDEPFSALDAQTRTLMMEELLGIWEQARTSIVYVTHNIQEAVYMADRVVVLSRRPGRVLDVVPIELKRPRHEGQMGEPAFVHAAERIWGLIKTQAQAALREGRA